MFEDLQYEPKQYPCGVRSLMEQLDSKDLKIIQDALNDSRWNNQALARAINSRGFAISGVTLSRHRRGECSCLKG